MATDRLSKLLEKSARLEAQIRDAKAQLKERDRKLDARRKIMAGINALEIAEEDPEFLAKLAARMNRTITRPQDRAMYDFLEGMTPPVRPASAASEGFAEAAGSDKPKDG